MLKARQAVGTPGRQFKCAAFEDAAIVADLPQCCDQQPAAGKPSSAGEIQLLKTVYSAKTALPCGSGCWPVGKTLVGLARRTAVLSTERVPDSGGNL